MRTARAVANRWMRRWRVAGPRDRKGFCQSLPAALFCVVLRLTPDGSGLYSDPMMVMEHFGSMSAAALLLAFGAGLGWLAPMPVRATARRPNRI